jgi:coenzyme F420-0:L-glutamate ligase / coenzyme F420-1:gamma-L-glutamate ligase
MLTLAPLTGIPLIRQGDNLADLVLKTIQKNNITLEDNDILIFAQKIVSKAEGRAANLAAVIPTQRALELAAQTEKDARLVELILQESNEVLRTRPGTIIVEHRLGFVCANAGIDHSNVAGGGNTAEEWVLLLPAAPDDSAEMIRKEISSKTGKHPHHRFTWTRLA